MNRTIKFRQLFECEKGHTRWAYFWFPDDISSDLKMEWGEKVNCDCSVGMKGIYSPTKRQQQYTGLKDKNGKEIYEGDIISLVRCSQKHFSCGCEKKPDLDFTGEVIFENGSFVCKEVSGNISEYEVIGNIYENQDLLKESL